MRWGGRPHWTCGICDETKLIPRPGGQSQQHGKLNPTHYATGGPTMPVGPVSGEIVDNLLISSVAANTQAHETTAVHQPDPTSDWSEKVEFPFHDVDFIWFTVAQNVFLCRRWMVLFRAAINCTCTTLVLYLPKTGNIFSERKKMKMLKTCEKGKKRVVVATFPTPKYILLEV